MALNQFSRGFCLDVCSIVRLRVISFLRQVVPDKDVSTYPYQVLHLRTNICLPKRNPVVDASRSLHIFGFCHSPQDQMPLMNCYARSIFRTCIMLIIVYTIKTLLNIYHSIIVFVLSSCGRLFAISVNSYVAAAFISCFYRSCG